MADIPIQLHLKISVEVDISDLPEEVLAFCIEELSTHIREELATLCHTSVSGTIDLSEYAFANGEDCDFNVECYTEADWITVTPA